MSIPSEDKNGLLTFHSSWPLTLKGNHLLPVLSTAKWQQLDFSLIFFLVLWSKHFFFAFEWPWTFILQNIIRCVFWILSFFWERFIQRHVCAFRADYKKQKWPLEMKHQKESFSWSWSCKQHPLTPWRWLNPFSHALHNDVWLQTKYVTLSLNTAHGFNSYYICCRSTHH